MSKSASTAEALSKGRRLQQAGELALAEQTYRQSLELDETCAELWHLLGAVRRSLRKPVEAADCFRRAVALKPDDVDARNSLAVALAELRQFAEAVTEFRRAIALRPGDAEIRVNLGLALREQGRMADAAAAWRVALELKPAHAGAKRCLDEIRRQNGFTAPSGTSATGESVPADRPDAKRIELAAVLDAAWHAHTSGNLLAAESGYRKGLEFDDTQPDVWYLLGAVLQSRKRFDEAVRCFERAIGLDPNYAEAHNYLAVALVSQNKLDEAAEAFRRATQLRPRDIELRVNLGVALRLRQRHAEAIETFRAALTLEPGHAKAQSLLRRSLRSLGRDEELVAEYQRMAASRPESLNALLALGLSQIDAKRYEDAVETFRRVLSIEPGSPRFLNNLGLALAGGKQLDEAIGVYREALRIKPDFAEAHNNLGVTLAKKERRAEALAHYREAIRLQASFAQAHANLGAMLANRGDLEAGERHQRRALELRPKFAEAHCNLGAVLMQRGRFDEAEAALRRALDLKPDFIEAQSNLGGALAARGDLAAAEDCYALALKLDPQFPGARYNRSLGLLAQGLLAEGWRDYEFRFQCDEFNHQKDRGPRWDGSPLGGRTLLVHAEQGLGDTLQFCRYLPMAAALGGRVIFECQKPLVTLMQRLSGLPREGVEIVPPGGEPPKYDVQSPLLSLPHVFGTTLDSVPGGVPYLAADEKLVRQWRWELRDERALKVGIAWQGNPKYRNDARRSVPLVMFEALASVDNVRLFSLQKNHGREQLEAAPFADKIVDLAPRLDEEAGPFQDTAAVMMNLDLVISSDTAVVHLAGALGVPVWVAIPSAPDWRWLLDRDDSPWYPSVRLFRQRRPGDWGDVFERIAAAARQLAGQGAAPRAAASAK